MSDSDSETNIDAVCNNSNCHGDDNDKRYGTYCDNCESFYCGSCTYPYMVDDLCIRCMCKYKDELEQEIKKYKDDDVKNKKKNKKIQR